MSLPITAGGPLKVLTNPILMVFCWAMTGPTASIRQALATNRVFRIGFLPRAFLAHLYRTGNVPASAPKGPPAPRGACARMEMASIWGVLAMRRRAAANRAPSEGAHLTRRPQRKECTARASCRHDRGRRRRATDGSRFPVVDRAAGRRAGAGTAARRRAQCREQEADLCRMQRD